MSNGFGRSSSFLLWDTFSHAYVVSFLSLFCPSPSLTCPFPILPPTLLLLPLPDSTVSPSGFGCRIHAVMNVPFAVVTTAGGERPNLHRPQMPRVSHSPGPQGRPFPRAHPPTHSRWRSLSRGTLPVPGAGSRRGRARAMESAGSSPPRGRPGPELTFSLIASLPALHLHVRAALSRTASGLRRVGELCK